MSSLPAPGSRVPGHNVRISAPGAPRPPSCESYVVVAEELSYRSVGAGESPYYGERRTPAFSRTPYSFGIKTPGSSAFLSNSVSATV